MAASASPAASAPVAPSLPMREVAPWLVTVAITIGSMMGALDTSIVNVALPYIRANLGATFTEVAWVSTGYAIALVIIMPLTAWLGLTFGRKRVYMFCLGLFTAASFFCGAARGLYPLLLFRVIQGIGAGALQPVQLAILRETYPPEKQGMAMGLYGLAVMIGPAIGPTLGGWITDNYAWPWIFYINVPIGFFALWMVSQFIHDPPHLKALRGTAGVDAFGIGMLTVGLASLQTVLEEGERYEWFNSGFILMLTAVSGVSLALLVWWELRVDKPAVDLSVLKNASFTSATLIGGVVGVSLFASMFLLPLFMQELMHYTATKSGLMLMPRSLVMLVLMPVAGALYNRLGPRLLIGGGLLLGGIAPIMMSHLTLEAGTWDLFWPQLVQGFGFVFVFIPLSTAALAGVQKAKLTAGAGLYNLVRQLGGSFGTAIFATLLTRLQQSNHAVLAEQLSPYNPAFVQRLQMIQQGFIAQGIASDEARLKALKLLDGLVRQQAAVLAFERCFFLIGALFLICLPMLFLLRSSPTGEAGHAEPVEV
jgi:MFS transporter, DHA2 family, multidrug resistance protein